MAYRRKRKSRGTWLPTFGVDQDSQQDDTYTVSGAQLELEVDPVVDPVPHTIIPITMDEPREEVAPTQSLADYIGSEYFLKRIVGKIHLLATRDSDDGDYDVLVCAGFFVARCDEGGNAPIGYTGGSATAQFNDYNPLAQKTAREPWIWRRSWMLGDRPVNNTSVNASYEAFPRTNSSYGSIQDGPHIDAKTRRRVSSDDRLFFTLAAVPFPIRPYQEYGLANITINGWLDYRLFGSARRARQRGAF